MRKKSPFFFYALILFSSCGFFLDSLREEVADELEEEEELAVAAPIAERGYARIKKRELPPPPATVKDNRTMPIAGTPVDYSGLRAKTGRITKKDFLEEATKNENSLWSEDGQSNYFFSRNKLKMPGDLITVLIEEDLKKTMINEVKRKLLPPEHRNQEVFIPGLTEEKPGPDSKQRAPAAPTTSGPSAGTSKRLPDDTFTAEVVEVYPNGNLRVRGMKHIPFKRHPRDLEITAIVKASAVPEDDVVKSSHFFEKKVELYR